MTTLNLFFTVSGMQLYVLAMLTVMALGIVWSE